MPCADNCNDETEQPQTTISANNNHAHNDNKKETCSPFCICSCCGVRVSLPIQILFPTAALDTKTTKQFSNYTFSFQSVQFNIWQPPKLS